MIENDCIFLLIFLIKFKSSVQTPINTFSQCILMPPLSFCELRLKIFTQNHIQNTLEQHNAEHGSLESAQAICELSGYCLGWQDQFENSSEGVP